MQAAHQLFNPDCLKFKRMGPDRPRSCARRFSSHKERHQCSAFQHCSKHAAGTMRPV